METTLMIDEVTDTLQFSYINEEDREELEEKLMEEVDTLFTVDIKDSVAFVKF